MLRERLLQFIKSQHLTISRFESIVGLSNGAVSRTNEKIRPRTLDSILAAFPQLNRDWLITGDGEMIKEEFPTVLDESNLVPLVNIDSVGGTWSQNSIQPSEQYIIKMIPLPDSRTGDVAILQSGDSMTPHIPAGSILQIRKVEEWREYLGYGNVYVLWLKDGRRITKLVKKCETDSRNYVLCCSYNPDFADEELPRSFIQEIWKVVNVLINKGW